MRLFCTRAGRNLVGYYQPVPLSQRVYTVEEMEAIILQFVTPNGLIDRLCLDFNGLYIPIERAEEARLAARLVCVYHNENLQQNLQVYMYIVA